MFEYIITDGNTYTEAPLRIVFFSNAMIYQYFISKIILSDISNKVFPSLLIHDERSDCTPYTRPVFILEMTSP